MAGSSGVPRTRGITSNKYGVLIQVDELPLPVNRDQYSRRLSMVQILQQSGAEYAVRSLRRMPWFVSVQVTACMYQIRVSYDTLALYDMRQNDPGRSDDIHEAIEDDIRQAFGMWPIHRTAAPKKVAAAA